MVSIRSAWPRTDATIYGQALADTLIPQRVVNASYVAAYIKATAPGSLSVTVDPSKRVKRQKVDTIEREFLELGDISAAAAPVSSAIEGLLAPLLVPVIDSPVGIWSVGC